MLRSTSLLFVVMLFGLTSCEFSHDEVYEEPITSALLVLTPDSGTTVILQYLDKDGNGGRPAIVSGGSLMANTTYNCELLLNTVGKHITDTTSIAKQPEIHQIFYMPQNGLTLKTKYADIDANGFPIGMSSTMSTHNKCQGTFTIIIKHDPNKSAEGVANGDIDNARGKTDFEASFEISVS